MKLNCCRAGVFEHIFCLVLSSHRKTMCRCAPSKRVKRSFAARYKIMSINMELFESIASAAI